jgi:GNAT superfamily N-acetyltransferase
MTTASQSGAGIVIGRRQLEDREALEHMYREVFGAEALERSRERWKWQYEKNPHCPPEGPEIWVAKEHGQILGQYASMPVRLKVGDRMVRASWGMDVMVKPNLQGKGVGSKLFQYWDEQVEASLGLGLSLASYRLFQKLKWKDVGPVPCYTRPLDPYSLLARRLGPVLGRMVAPLAGAAHWVVYPGQRASRVGVRVSLLETPFGPAFDRLWEKASTGYDFVAERKSRYLEWKYREIPYVTYEIYQAHRGDELVGYVVLRSAEKNKIKLGLVVDLFAHPEDEEAVDALVDLAARWGRDNRVARLQTFTFDRRLAKRYRRKGFMSLKSPMQFCLQIHSDHIDESFFRDTSRWHVTFGDSDMDREP